MTPTQERMAEALAIERMYGANGPRWIAERIATFVAADDAAAVERFMAIAAEYEKLLGGHDPMTRAGEKLYGDWGRQGGDTLRPLRWRRVAYVMGASALVIVIVSSALFGFG